MSELPSGATIGILGGGQLRQVFAGILWGFGFQSAISRYRKIKNPAERSCLSDGCYRHIT